MQVFVQNQKPIEVYTVAVRPKGIYIKNSSGLDFLITYALTACSNNIEIPGI